MPYSQLHLSAAVQWRVANGCQYIRRTQSWLQMQPGPSINSWPWQGNRSELCIECNYSRAGIFLCFPLLVWVHYGIAHLLNNSTMFESNTGRVCWYLISSCITLHKNKLLYNPRNTPYDGVGCGFLLIQNSIWCRVGCSISCGWVNRPNTCHIWSISSSSRPSPGCLLPHCWSIQTSSRKPQNCLLHNNILPVLPVLTAYA